MISTAPNLTQRGKSLLMRAIGGEQITFTRFKIGSGALAEGQTGEELNDLIEPVLAFAITDMDDSQEGLLAISGEFDNNDISSDFLWREMGVYAKGEDDTEMLYAYANDGENAGMLRALNTEILTEQTITLIVAIGEAERVTAVFSPRQQYALAEDFNQHKNSQDNPHHVTKAQIGLENVENKAPKDMTIPFAEPASQEPPEGGGTHPLELESGGTLGALFGKLKAVVRRVLAHMADGENPHGVTLEQVGGAAKSHTHSAENIESGVLPVSVGGTGVSTTEALRALIGTNAEIGIYTGSGSTKRGIQLGFVPSAVILFNEYGQTWDDTEGTVGGMAVGLYGTRSKASSSTTHATVWNDDYTALLPGADAENGFAGFWVNQHTGSNADENISTNKSGAVYHYIAFR